MTGMCYTVAAKTNTDGAFCFSDASRSQLHITRYGQSAPYVLDLRPAVRLGNDRQAHRGRFVMGKWSSIADELYRLEREIRELTGFELFGSPRFMEDLVCKLCGLNHTEHRTRWDGETDDGMRVEIKHSNVTYSKGRTSRLHSKTFRWECLQGGTRKGKRLMSMY
jgi:hypothetical protein